MSNKSGFTIVELLVVIAIIGILTAVSIPNLISWRQTRSYTASLQRTISVMHSAKARAVKENVSTVVGFDRDGQSFRAFVDLSVPRNDVWDPGTDRPIDFYEMPPGIQITHAAFEDDAAWIRFDGLGTPNGFGGRVELTSDRGLSNAVRVNITGRIQVTEAEAAD